ncbi:Transglycosylase [Chryseobacterium arachidis]|uniref:Transglycosylase n=1 Tax=Chryseobacterium arachidis TaxID=1416778 RepID=A0A1M5LTD3_9FLAO|nr:transglycosylase domain-containing protein [Chryseobacterium arachidis]SHG68246.1 Transglycosylase [Chryseobacterium arachidis]
MKYFRRIFIVTATAFIVFLLYCEFGGKFILNDSDKQMIAYEIRSSEEIPDNFTNFYNTIYPNSLSENSWNYIFSALIDQKAPRKECHCNQMAYRFFPILEINHKKGIDQFLTARFIENKFSQKECLQFNFNHFDFLENRKGLTKISKSLFNKEIKDLQPLEMAEILALYENPVRNNRNRNPENAKKRTAYLYNLYIKNSNSKN